MADMVREEDIIAQINSWRKEARSLDARIKEGEAALKFIQGFRKPLGSDTATTVADMALDVLRSAHPDGLSKADIITAASEKFKKEINPNTLGVTLSDRLAKDLKRVKFDGTVWLYVPQKGETVG